MTVRRVRAHTISSPTLDPYFHPNSAAALDSFGYSVALTTSTHPLFVRRILYSATFPPAWPSCRVPARPMPARRPRLRSRTSSLASARNPRPRRLQDHHQTALSRCRRQSFKKERPQSPAAAAVDACPSRGTAEISRLLPLRHLLRRSRLGRPSRTSEATLGSKP